MGRPPPKELEVGALFDERYLVESVLGRGGMGAVYRARDQAVGEVVALKVLDFGTREEATALERFRREVRLSRRVTHPNIARTFDLGERDGLHYLTMELVEGRDLASVLRESGPLSPERIAEIGVEIARGLAAAHEAGVIHRDLKPQNVLIDAHGRAKVTDFGVARPVREEDGIQTLGILGTPAYMAPEQVRGYDVDPRTDVYALGLVLYEMASGERPFRGGSPMTVAVRRLDHAPEDPRRKREVPDALAELILDCLARAPSARPQTATEVAAALGALARDPEALTTDATSRVASTSASSDTIASDEPRPRPRLAVLPFVYRGPPDDAYVGDSFADELIDVLCRTRGLSVLASAATAGYRDRRDPRVIGRELDVDAVVDGSVQSAGSRIRISARLCDAQSGEQLASERWDADLTDIFDVQDKVSRRVAEALRVNLASSSSGGIRASREAVELYLRARRQLGNLVFAGDDGSVALLERALDAAPDFAPAAAAHAIACVRAWFVPNLVPGRDFEPEAREAVERALAIAPDVAETHLAAGLLAKTDGDYHRAVRAYRTAVDVAPTYAAALEGIGILECEGGRRRRGMQTLRRTLELDPTRSLALHTLAREHAFDRNHADFDRLIALIDAGPQSGQLPTLSIVLRAASWRGDFETVREVADALPRGGDGAEAMLVVYAEGLLGELSQEQVRTVSRSTVASVGNPRFRRFAQQLATELCAQTGLVEEAHHHLRSVVEDKLIDLSWLDLCPALDVLRDDARYAPLRRVVHERVGRIWTT